MSLRQRAQGLAAVARHRFLQRGGDAATFDRRYPDEVWFLRAEEVIAKSNCLADRFGTVVDDSELSAELDRMRRSSMEPEGLAALLAALKHDPVMIKECLVRPLLVEHLLRNRVAWDPTIQRQARARAAALGAVGSPEAFADQVHEDGGVAQAAVLCGDSVGEADPAATTRGRVRVDAATVARLQDRLESRGPGVELVEESDAVLAVFVSEPTEDGVSGVLAVVPKVSLETWWRRHGGLHATTLPQGMHATPSSSKRRGRSGAGLERRSGWQVRELPAPGLTGATAVWTGEEMIVFGGLEGVNRGWRYDPSIDRWSVTSAEGIPSRRIGHTAVWTGSEMVVWGGTDGSSMLRTGAAYDPVADAWRTVRMAGAPSARADHTAVWTGEEMIVWGGHLFDEYGMADGGSYEPESDTWISTVDTGAPEGRFDHTAVWTGTEMIVWGGLRYSEWSFVDDGGIYDPENRTWVTIEGGVVTPRGHHSAVWTGTEMIIWGGEPRYRHGALADGARFLRSRNRWREMSTAGEAPSGRWGHSAVWTGTEMIIWGGVGWEPLQSGALYDPVRDSWRRMERTGNPGPRSGHVAVWTGAELLVWGGETIGGILVNDGGRFDPDQDSWIRIAAGDGPEHRTGESAVWTGAELIVWGGGSTSDQDTGFRYQPDLDSWEQISSDGAPCARREHAAVWTGEEMIVWGGLSPQYGDVNSGGRYDPVADSWSATELEGAPKPRTGPVAVWSGTEMIVWGGRTATPPKQDLFTGGRYDPVSGSWAAMSTDTAPPARDGYQGVWTGEWMLVCGGYSNAPELAYGSLYSPSEDSWTPVSEPPVQRSDFGLVWTGTEALLWSGTQSRAPDDGNGTGERYDPVSDTWVELEVRSAPSARSGHAAVWTGEEMIVWGGVNLNGWGGAGTDGVLKSGGRFLPETDEWLGMGPEPDVQGRTGHHALWTGSGMMVYGGEGGTGLMIYYPYAK